MAGFLRSHGVLVRLALAVAMATLAPAAQVGAEPGHHVTDHASHIAGESPPPPLFVFFFFGTAMVI